MNRPPSTADRPATPAQQSPRQLPPQRNRDSSTKVGHTNGKPKIIRILPADFYVSTRPGEILTMVLGSCIAVCMRDPEICCGGMNHFLLPQLKQVHASPGDFELRYGSYSIERLTNVILSLGGKRQRLEVKVFGGANVLHHGSDIGTRNAEFVIRYLTDEGFKITAQHLGGAQNQVFQQEARLRAEPILPEGAGHVEIFK